jgi:hypothetical protein
MHLPNDVFDAVDSLLREGRVVLLRAGRRCITRGRLGGHSDRAWDDGSRESRRRGFQLLATAYLSTLTLVRRRVKTGSLWRAGLTFVLRPS